MDSEALSPLDGRYGDRLAPLSRYFSEKALVATRCQVELAWAETLTQLGIFPSLSSDERTRFAAVRAGFGDREFARIKELEAATRHDVKACELFLRERLQLANPNVLHFGLTSEDVNNLAYSLLLRDYLAQAQLPLLDRLIARLADLAARWRSAPFPTRTHGQLASPSTAGKELAVFLSRLLRHRRKLAAHQFKGKLNGATGNWSALFAACPDRDWVAITRRFVEQQGLSPNLVTTQIEDHDGWADYLNRVRQLNNVVLDLDQDVWLYLSFGYFRQVPARSEVGSSTMPHKVNPIRFENSEGNLGLSNALLVELSNKLCRSRMQRDLSDSTVERNLGVALGHAHLAWEETVAGLERLELDEARCRAELEQNPALLAEPIQTILRLAGAEDPYELLRQATRGKPFHEAQLQDLIEALPVDEPVRRQLRALRVYDYLGAAERICDEVVAEARKVVG